MDRPYEQALIRGFPNHKVSGNFPERAVLPGSSSSSSPKRVFCHASILPVRPVFRNGTFGSKSRRLKALVFSQASVDQIAHASALLLQSHRAFYHLPEPIVIDYLTKSLSQFGNRFGVFHPRQKLLNRVPLVTSPAAMSPRCVPDSRMFSYHALLCLSARTPSRY
jgi:hypothetical protein